MADVVLHSSSLINYINIQQAIFRNPAIQNETDFIAVVERGSCSVGDKTCTFHRLYWASRTHSTCQRDSWKRKLSTEDKCLGDGQNKINSSTEKVGRNVGDALIKRSSAWSWEGTSGCWLAHILHVFSWDGWLSLFRGDVIDFKGFWWWTKVLLKCIISEDNLKRTCRWHSWVEKLMKLSVWTSLWRSCRVNSSCWDQQHRYHTISTDCCHLMSRYCCQQHNGKPTLAC